MENTFNPIETQEQLDSIIKDRIDRAKKTAEAAAKEKYADYDEVKTNNENLAKQVADLTKKLEEAGTEAEGSTEKINGLTGQIDELKQQVATYENVSVKTKVAAEMGLGLDALEFLQGDDEEAIRKSAESLKALVGKNVAPLAHLEGNQDEDGVTAAFKKLNPNIKI